LSSKLQFQGRSALISGAASGIGRATAQWLDAQGIASLILVDLNGPDLETLDLSCQTRLIVGDVSDASLWDRIETETQSLDHALINAGVPPSCLEIADTPIDMWKRVIAINLDGMFLGLRCAMRVMRRGSGGSVVLTSSVAGIKPLPNTGDYAAAKAGVVQLARVAAIEGAKHGIRVNVVAPGGVDTGIWDAQDAFRQAVSEGGGDRAAVIAAMGAQGTPRGHWARPDEMADSIGFLLSDMAANITGALLVSDGGISL
jgi:NAD(P)-dependent dehydrogenase (short-subunit alcohol dehydrogenase family)